MHRDRDIVAPGDTPVFVSPDFMWISVEMMVTTSQRTFYIDDDSLPEKKRLSVSDPQVKSGYNVIARHSEERVIREIFKTSSLFRMYGTPKEFVTELKQYSNFPGSHKFFITLGPSTYYTAPSVHYCLSHQRFLAKSDMFVSLQTFMLSGNPDTRDVIVRSVFAVFLKSQEEQLSNVLEFVRFDDQIHDEIQNDILDVKMTYVDPKFQIRSDLFSPEVLNKLVDDFKGITVKQMTEKLTKLVPINWKVSDTKIISNIVEDAKDRMSEEQFVLYMVCSYTNCCVGLKTLRNVMKKTPEWFSPRTGNTPTEMCPITVRLFEDGPRQFAMKSEFQRALQMKNSKCLEPPSKCERILSCCGFEAIDTISFEEIVKKHKGELDGIIFIRYPIVRTKHKAIPVKGWECSADFFILAVDAIFEIFKNLIWGDKLFQNFDLRFKRDLYALFGEISQAMKPDWENQTFIQIHRLREIIQQCEARCYFQKQAEHKEIRDVKKRGFKVDDLKKELRYLELETAFPEITAHADVVYAEVMKKKEEKVLRTCDMFDAVEMCQIICILNKFPKIKTLIHNQKACHRLPGIICNTCDADWPGVMPNPGGVNPPPSDALFSEAVVYEKTVDGRILMKDSMEDEEEDDDEDYEEMCKKNPSEKKTVSFHPDVHVYADSDYEDVRSLEDYEDESDEDDDYYHPRLVASDQEIVDTPPRATSPVQDSPVDTEYIKIDPNFKKHEIQAPPEDPIRTQDWEKLDPRTSEGPRTHAPEGFKPDFSQMDELLNGKIEQIRKTSLSSAKPQKVAVKLPDDVKIQKIHGKFGVKIQKALHVEPPEEILRLCGPKSKKGLMTLSAKAGCIRKGLKNKMGIHYSGELVAKCSKDMVHPKLQIHQNGDQLMIKIELPQPTSVNKLTQTDAPPKIQEIEKVKIRYEKMMQEVKADTEKTLQMWRSDYKMRDDELDKLQKKARVNRAEIDMLNTDLKLKSAETVALREQLKKQKDQSKKKEQEHQKTLEKIQSEAGKKEKEDAEKLKKSVDKNSQTTAKNVRIAKEMDEMKKKEEKMKKEMDGMKRIHEETKKKLKEETETMRKKMLEMRKTSEEKTLESEELAKENVGMAQLLRSEQKKSAEAEQIIAQLTIKLDQGTLDAQNWSNERIFLQEDILNKANVIRGLQIANQGMEVQNKQDFEVIRNLLEKLNGNQFSPSYPMAQFPAENPPSPPRPPPLPIGSERARLHDQSLAPPSPVPPQHLQLPKIAETQSPSWNDFDTLFTLSNPATTTSSSTSSNQYLTSSSKECVICMGGLSPLDTSVSCNVCGWMFHAQCTSQWLTVNSSCPICRGCLANPQ